MKTIRTLLYAETFLGLILIAGCKDNNRIANSPPSDTAPLITEIIPEGEVSTFLLGLNNQGFTDGVAENGTIYFSDVHNHAVRRINLE